LEHEISRLGLLPERPAKKTFNDLNSAKEFYVFRKRYSKFMCELYDHWINSNNTTFKIRELFSMLNAIVGGRSTICVDTGPCVGRYFGVDVSATIAHCDKFFDDQRFCFGNLESMSISEIMTSNKLLDAQEIERTLREKCKPCDWYNICQGGCLYDAILFENSGLKNRMKVCHTRIIYDYIYKNLLNELVS